MSGPLEIKFPKAAKKEFDHNFIEWTNSKIRGRVSMKSFCPGKKIKGFDDLTTKKAKERDGYEFRVKINVKGLPR